MRIIDGAFERLQARGDAERPRGVTVSTDSRIPIIPHVARNTTFTRGVDIVAPLGLSALPLLPPEPSFDLCLPLPDRRGQSSRPFHPHFHNYGSFHKRGPWNPSGDMAEGSEGMG